MMDEYAPTNEYAPINEYHPEDEYAPVDEPAPAAPVETAVQPPRPVQPAPAQGYPAYPPVQQAFPQQGQYRHPQEVPSPQAQEPYAYTAMPQPYYAPYPTQPYAAPVYPAYPPVQPVAQPLPQPAPQPTQQQRYQQPCPMPQPPQVPQQQPVRPAQGQYQPERPAPVQPAYQNAPIAGQVRDANPFAPVAGYPSQPYPAKTAKPATPTGTKVFLIVLSAVLLAMVGGFIAYIVSSVSRNEDHEQSRPSDSLIIDNGGEDNPFQNDSLYIGQYDEVEDTIALKADNGDTLKRDNDNPDSVGQPDEKAENITINTLPKDKDNAKYTTQSAYESISDSVVTVVCYEGEITDDETDIKSQGTGTIISADGYIITNAHVLANSRIYAVNIVMNSGDEYRAKIIGYDTWTDLAVLKVDAKGLKPVTFGDSDLIEIGDDVIAVGSPGGEKFRNSLTKGIVSAVDRELSINRYVRYIQSDAAISPGNSGGPLCNIYGQVVGITTAKTIATNFENMSFSIPSRTVEDIVGDLMRYGYVKGRCRIGFSGAEISEEEVYYYSTPAGVVIGTIDESGSLAGSKIQEGDIITELDGVAITSFQDIYDVLADHKPGDEVRIKAQRPQD